MRRPRKVRSRSHAALHPTFNVATDSFRMGTPSQTASLCSSFCLKLSIPADCCAQCDPQPLNGSGCSRVADDIAHGKASSGRGKIGARRRRKNATAMFGLHDNDVLCRQLLLTRAQDCTIRADNGRCYIICRPGTMAPVTPSGRGAGIRPLNVLYRRRRP